MNSIIRDPALCGHALTSLPERIWEFSSGDFSFYEQPGERIVDKDYIFAQKVHYRSGNSYLFRTEICTEKLTINLIEFIARRILGSLAALASLLVAVPIGFTAKVLHAGFRQISQFPFSQKIRQIWNDESLYGHTLTSAPGKLFQITTAPLHWHLTSNGTDRRKYIAIYGPNETFRQEAEYQLFPFELFEIMYRGLSGAAALTASALSPLGLAAKAVHRLKNEYT